MATEPREETLDERLRTVERALTDDETPVPDLADAAAVEERLDGTADRLDDVEERLGELAASVQAVRGYVGEVRERREEGERNHGALDGGRDRGRAARTGDRGATSRWGQRGGGGRGDGRPDHAHGAGRCAGSGDGRPASCPRCGSTAGGAPRGEGTSDPGRAHPLPEVDDNQEDRSLLDRLLDR